MRKVFIIVIVIFLCIFVYFGGKMLVDYFNDVYIVMSDPNNNSSVSGTFSFKSTPENIELINSYLAVNNSFIDEMTKEVNNEKTINNVYELMDFFPSFKMYYSFKLKLENAIFNELPDLYNKTVSLSDLELKTFFENNTVYLDKYFGITTLEQLTNIVDNLSTIKSGNFKFGEVIASSIFYNPYGECTVFLLDVTNDNGDFISFSINSYLGYDTENQKAPVLVFDALGGMS